MLTLRCPITKTSVRMAGFGTEDVRISAPHPLLCTSAQNLAKITDINSPTDYHIMLCAWMEQLSQIKVAYWNGALDVNNFSVRWYESKFDSFVTLARWLVHNSNHPFIAQVPQLRLNPDLTSHNVQSWAESCQNILGTYTTYFEAAEAREIRVKLEAAERLLNDHAIDDSKLSVTARKMRSRKSYLMSCLAVHENQQTVDLVLKVCLSPQLYEVVTIQKVKEFCLDYLLENGIDNYNDKQDIIHSLDAIIVDKIGMASILGCGSAANAEIMESINAKYSIEIDGKTFLNGAIPKVTQALQRQANVSITSGDIVVKTYDREPVRAEFKTQLGYNIAHKQWAQQQTNK